MDRTTVLNWAAFLTAAACRPIVTATIMADRGEVALVLQGAHGKPKGKIMTDAPRLSPADELSDRIAHAPLFTRVTSRPLKIRLEEAVGRMSGLGENAESEYQRALAALRDVADEAIDALRREFEALGTDEYVNRWAVVQLLSDLENPRALTTLDKIIASPLPDNRSQDPHGSAAARELVVRTTAVEAVSRLAAGGSSEARAALLRYVRHSVRSVKIAAVLAVVEQGGSKARKELQGRLAKSDHWMLKVHRVHPRDMPPLEGHRFLPPKSPPEAVMAPRPTTGAGGSSGQSESKAARGPRDGRPKPDIPPKASPVRPKKPKG